MQAQTRSAGSIFFGLFGLAFAAVTLAFGASFFGDDLRSAWRLRSWIEAPATLVEVHGHPRGMGARYRYQYNGRNYDGARVGFYDHVSGSSVNELHRGNYRRLRALLEAAGPVRSVRSPVADGHALRAVGEGAPIAIRLNPANPEEAVIDPTVRLDRNGMLALGALVAMGLAFSAIGFFGMRGVSAQYSAEAMRVRRPIHGSSHRFPVAGWMIALAWNAMVAAVGSDTRPVAGRELLAWGALAAFALVGLLILWRVVLATLRWKRYRGLVLTLDPYPGEAGGFVAGSLVVPVRYDAGYRFRLVLSCTEHGQRGGELKKRNSYQRTLFHEEALAEARLAPGGTRIKFRFEVPPEAPASEGYLEPTAWTRATADRIFIRWWLEVSAAVEGVDLRESFELPVRRVAPGDAARTAAATTHAPSARTVAMPPLPVAPQPAPAESLEPGLERAIQASRPGRRAAEIETSGAPAYRYERDGDRIRVTQPAWEKPGAAGSLAGVAGGLAVCAAFAAVGVFLLLEREWLIGSVFALIGGVLVLGSLGYLAHALEVEVDDDGVRIERRIGGLRLKRSTLPAHHIAAVEARAESSAQSSGSLLLRSVRVRMLNGDTHTVAELIPHEREAVALRNLLAARLSVGAAGSAAVAELTTRTPQPGARAPSRWVSMAGVATALLFFGYQLWPFAGSLLGWADPGRAPALGQRTVAQSGAPPAPQHTDPPLDAGDWRSRFARASRARIEQRPGDALRDYGAALAIIERSRGANDPLAAALHERIADTHASQRNHAQAEAALQRALSILERHPHAALRHEARKLVLFDRESVLRHLGATYWELRRYADALTHYQRAYDTVAELDIDDSDRNYRLAFSAAGIMVSACMVAQWERADRAMAELKARLPRLSAHAQRQLDYWVRTGEPRLAARKC